MKNCANMVSEIKGKIRVNISPGKTGRDFSTATRYAVTIISSRDHKM